MAMNKKELAEFEDLKKQVATAKALRFTDTVERDLKRPEPCSNVEYFGWDFNSHCLRIERVWTSSQSHGTCSDGVQVKPRHLSQNGVSLFSTKLLALRGMRNEVETESAKKLAQIDEMIADELAKKK